MKEVRKSDQRGRTNMGWLDSRHTFSFGHYYDPDFVGFRSLRVINDDRVDAGAGFGTHPHDNMEIVSYVVEGALEHKDSLGTGSVIRPGDVQRMSAGTGIRHNEFNASKTEPVRFLQIWIPPAERGLEPSYEQKKIDPASAPGELRLLLSPDGRDGSVTIHRDVCIWGAHLNEGQSVSYELKSGRHAWIQVVNGGVSVLGEELIEGDGLAVVDEPEFEISYLDEGAEVLVFDLD